MEIVPLTEKPANWDEEISKLDSRTLFHETPWLEHIQSIHPKGRLRYFEIIEKDQRQGYLCALQVRKAVLNIYGSPLGGTGTNYMGPVVNRDINQDSLAHALRTFVKRSPLTHLELANDILDTEKMLSHGFELHPGVTHMLELPGNEEDAWNQLKSSCRNRIRKAEKTNLKVEVVEDLSLADEYYDQFIEVYGKQGMVTPFSVDRPRSLLAQLLPAKRILPLRISLQGETVATGLFPFDKKCIYFWGAASWLRHHKLCPNELLHWEVIKFAISKGIPRYNMCGGTNQFKNKFGGVDVPYNHYSMSSVPMMKFARKMYGKAHSLKLQALGTLRTRSIKK